MSFADANNGTVVGTQFGFILRTTDCGETRVSQESGINRNYTLWGVSMTAADTGTVVGDEGTIARTNAGGGG